MFTIPDGMPSTQPPRVTAHPVGTSRWVRVGPATALVLAVAACGPSYSPNTYSGTAVQQANKVEQGVVIGVREVAVSVTGGVGAISGAAAGGITGAQVGTGAISALSALGGSLLGGVVGATAEKVTSDTKAFEYIVRKPNNELVSVTQKDDKPLELGARVLVITGAQARIVPDYTVHPEVATAPAGKPAADGDAAAQPRNGAAGPATAVEAAPAPPGASDSQPPSAGPTGEALSTPPATSPSPTISTSPAPSTPPVASASADPMSEPAKPAP